MGGERPLTPGEISLARSVFGNSIDYAKVRIRRRKWFPFQPRATVMAPLGHLHFHPHSAAYCDDFSAAPLTAQGLFIHEMTHVWQHQRGMFLPLRRLPFSRYSYRLKPGKKLHQYGVEQQAEIVRHAFLIARGGRLASAADQAVYRGLVSLMRA